MRTYRTIEPRANGLPNLERTYEGFDQKFMPASEVEHVVIVMSEGDIEVFAIDDPKKVADLFAFLEEREEAVTVLGCYSRRH